MEAHMTFQKHHGDTCTLPSLLKGLSHEIFGPVFWPVWMYIGLNKNRFWFLNFKEAPSIWCSYFKFLCVSVQTFLEILRISEKDWQLSLRFSNFRRFLVSGSLRNVAYGVNISRRIVESPRMIGNWVPSSRRRIVNWVPSSRRRIGN